MKSILISFFSLTLATTSVFANDNCSKNLEPKQADIAHSVAETVEKDLKSKGLLSGEAHGFAILIATMVASAAGTTYLNSVLPHDIQFLSLFVMQVSTMGVYVVGAPIWDPIVSALRKKAFGVRSSKASAETTTSPEFEELWLRTQQHYSLNAQMSRNVISQFLNSVRQNFYEAYRAIRSDDRVYAADQIADAAFRLKTLFREIDPRDASVASAVRAAFTNHIEIDSSFESEVLGRIRMLDPKFESPEEQAYYSRLLQTWLSN